MRARSWTRRTAAVVGLALVAGCSTPPSAAELATNSVESYMNALAAGYYGKACTALDSSARAEVAGPAGSRATCEAVLARCLPYNANLLKRDQSQLLYATVQVQIAHKHASAAVSGTVVARALKEVTLAKEQGHWMLTSYGSALRGCVTRAKAKLIRS